MGRVEKDDDPVVYEVTGWLSRDDFGLLSAVARLVGVTPTSVSAWAVGTTRPTEQYWPKLEEAFGQKAGHLGRIAAGDIEPRTTPVEVAVPRPPSMRRTGNHAPTPPADALAVLQEQVAQLVATVTDLAVQVRAQGADVARLLRRSDPPSSEASGGQP